MHLNTESLRHKKTSIFIFFNLLFSIFLYSQTFNITKGWYLLGASEDIDTLSSFTADCISSIHTYDKRKTPSWSKYPNGTLVEISKNQGFWINTKKIAL